MGKLIAAAGDFFLHGVGELADALATRGLVDEFEIHLDPLVWVRAT